MTSPFAHINPKLLYDSEFLPGITSISLQATFLELGAQRSRYL